jgi:uncharacterized protein involved in type VI secretion and phage assembly
VTAQGYFGKYRGVVADTKDPLGLGRIKARVPAVYGEQPSGWAMPCLPFAGANAGFFGLPLDNAGVWIEFESGDPNRPIWSGCWWGSSAEVPAALKADAAKKVLLRTQGGHSIFIDDTAGSGGITLETSGGQKITLTSSGVEITNGQAKVKLSGSQVTVNDGALEIT